ncbi:hypothetical protein ACRE_044480 [Hapsidospora chrysogenum ATCC 11550]|uniref:Uncharacterized protein n=1 Tax=Hapsidospora chrysogenum (strain ATCC 11550 / CBS 779.69 / DSM 880 / IAM 14645 / JCM 23072 / IMI 49137) TaxID=857340 RepID=A0A086T5T3_HAPC1|nr:hypothetical protein ACRE_044480 [Hapsidospora chrysogenum ATCC 11550]
MALGPRVGASWQLHPGSIFPSEQVHGNLVDEITPLSATHSHWTLAVLRKQISTYHGSPSGAVCVLGGPVLGTR